MILIVTHQRGFEADHVIDVLRARDVPLLRFNTDCSGEGDGIAADVSVGLKSTLYCDGRTLSLSEVTAAWFQQAPPGGQGTTTQKLAAQLRVESFRAAYDWIFDQVSAPWLNRPASVYAAANKMRQLGMASAAGLAVPRTMVANKADAVRRFAAEHDGNVIVKNLATPWYVGPSGTVAAFTKRLESTMLEDAPAIEFAPLVYQERIQRVLDVRVVVVGDRIFAAATESNAAAGQDDIRRVPLSEARYVPTELPSDVRGGLLKVMDIFDLQYCSADFVVADTGKWYFLDLNATGAFLWVEKLAGFAISACIADYLMSRR